MEWDLEERVEDSVAEWLKRQVSGDMGVYSAFDSTELRYPCAVVHCAESAPVSDKANWTNARHCAVMVAVITEAAPQKDESGEIVRAARQRAAAARAEIMGILVGGTFHVAAAADGSNDLNEIAYANKCIFASMQPVTVSRSVDGERRKFITEIGVRCIAQPV